jgi:hypothetical protein
MTSALKLILDFLLKSQIIQVSIAICLIILAISFGGSLYLQAKTGRCFTGIFGEIKQIINEVKE